MRDPNFKGAVFFAGGNADTTFVLPVGGTIHATGTFNIANFCAFEMNGGSVTAGILNFFDRKAPFDPIDYAGVNYNPTFDQSGAVGRSFTLGLRYKF